MEFLDPIYLASVEAVEETAVDTLVAGEDAPSSSRPAGSAERWIRRS